MLLKAVVLALVLLIIAALDSPADARSPGSLDASVFGDPRDLCARAISQEEREQGIPPRLMHAIALAESGRWDAQRQATVAWPWTINAEGEGRYFPSMGAAIAAVHALQARGVDRIDVGCMQVNLHYHGDAFTDLSEAFDPATNVAYAADFLKTLYAETGSWSEATGRYHSATPELSGPYRARVLAMWNDQRQRGLRGLAANERQLRLLPIDRALSRRMTLEQRIETLRAMLAKIPPDDRPIPLREIWLRSAQPPLLIVPNPSRTVVAANPPRVAGTQPPPVVRVNRQQDGKAFTDQRVAYLQAWREQQQRDREAAREARATSGRTVTVLRGDGRTVERVQTR
jgi:hypothetical protein